MRGEQLFIDGCWLLDLERHADARGWFCETFSSEALTRVTGRRLPIAQINLSESGRGVLRGIHYSMAHGGQAKYIQCIRGRVLDVIVDLRTGSPTFGESAAVELSEGTPTALFVSEGLGHGFLALDQPSVVMYATSSPYDPNTDLSVNPLDEDLALPWPTDINVILSERDRDAQSLKEGLRKGRLPRT